jgi:glucuronate isomerase
MVKEQFISELENLKVYDAHTHLVGDKLCAADFWEIVHYFWFLRELQGAGYPDDFDSLTEDKRIDAFLPAFQKTKGTGMHYSVKRIFKDLYDIEITDKRSVYEAMAKVKASFVYTQWARDVTAKGKVRYAIVNNEEHKNFSGLDGVSIWLPRIDGKLYEASCRIFDAETDKKRDAAEIEKSKLRKHLTECFNKGARAFMTTLGSFSRKTWKNNGDAFACLDDCYIYLLHVICKFVEEKKLKLQLFLGVEHGYCSVAVPVNNNERILNLYGLFEKYNIDFDLVVASEANNMDVVQAAHIFRNVYVGGMWWFNFRPSTYLDAMAKRFEVLASTKTYLSISDSRCIEWCYGKNALIKKLAADFLSPKVDEGFINYDEALEIAGDWLYASAERLYGTR